MKATSDNLPVMDIFIVADFFKRNDRFNVAEIYKIPDTAAIQRGRTLEKHVLLEVEKLTGQQLMPSGLILLTEYPLLGASPNAIHKDVVVEVKCPSRHKNLDENNSL